MFSVQEVSPSVSCTRGERRPSVLDSFVFRSEGRANTDTTTIRSFLVLPRCVVSSSDVRLRPNVHLALIVSLRSIITAIGVISVGNSRIHMVRCLVPCTSWGSPIFRCHHRSALSYCLAILFAFTVHSGFDDVDHVVGWLGAGGRADDNDRQGRQASPALVQCRHFQG